MHVWERACEVLGCFGRFGRLFVHEEAEFCHSGRTEVRQPKALSAAELACGGLFWLPNPAPESWTFGSGGEFRPPKVPPNMHEFRLWNHFRPPNLPSKVPCSAFFCMISNDCFTMF